jgi:spermidine/putrescine transport system ATP-binding protein
VPDAPLGDLRLVQLTKRFGGLAAVDGIDLTVPAGSFFALLGPSGCGKTTTLRMVAGLEEPTAGSILLGGDDITHRKPYRRPVNTVFQNYALFPHLDVCENVAFGLRRRGVRDVMAKVDEMLALVELAGYNRRKPAQLSGGQQQRVALARALINRPQVLLLDEPLGALDLKLRRQMQLELKRIQTEVGLTFVHVTHDQEEAMTMADTIAVMNGGRIEQLGTPAELYDRPATVFVANFLGQSNLVRASVVAVDGDSLLLDAHGHRVAVPRDRSRTDAADVFFGVRPEKIHLTPVAADDAGGVPNSFPGTIVDSSFIGVSTQYIVCTPWEQEFTVFAQNNGVAELLRRGDRVRMSWQAEHAFCLEASGDATIGVIVDDEAPAWKPAVARR